MPNMGYCRFHNTRADLNDCLYALREAVDGLEDIVTSLSELAEG